MKRVVLVRHAKSVPYGYEDDFNRPLSDRGKKDAAKISAELLRRGIQADAIISSPARRALKTARIFADTLSVDKNRIVEVEDIYDGMTTSEFIALIHQTNPEAETVFFFGHNPDFHYFVANLLRYFDGDMPTCSTVVIEYDVTHWTDIEARMGEKLFQLVPRMFR